MTRPITPQEVREMAIKNFPKEVIEAFNELISKNWTGSKAVVKQSEAVSLIVDKMNMSRDDVFNAHLLDVEPIFEKSGWTVKFDKPGYNETYEAFFVFTQKGSL